VIQGTLHLSNAMAGVVTGGIAAVTTVVMLIVSASSDRRGERFFHASASLAVVALVWASAALVSHPIARALVNSFGNLAGVVAPSGIGVLKEMTGSMTVGMLVLSVLSVCTAAMCIGLRWHGASALRCARWRYALIEAASDIQARQYTAANYTLGFMVTDALGKRREYLRFHVVDS
jgi:hypothetical protein